MPKYLGPTILRVGERSPKDKNYATDEYLLAPVGAVVAPRRKGETPSLENAARAIVRQAVKGIRQSRVKGAQGGAVLPGLGAANAALGQPYYPGGDIMGLIQALASVKRQMPFGAPTGPKARPEDYQGIPVFPVGIPEVTKPKIPWANPNVQPGGTPDQTQMIGPPAEGPGGPPDATQMIGPPASQPGLVYDTGLLGQLASPQQNFPASEPFLDMQSAVTAPQVPTTAPRAQEQQQTLNRLNRVYLASQGTPLAGRLGYILQLVAGAMGAVPAGQGSPPAFQAFRNQRPDLGLPPVYQ